MVSGNQTIITYHPDYLLYAARCLAYRTGTRPRHSRASPGRRFVWMWQQSRLGMSPDGVGECVGDFEALKDATDS
jgi:hypothetical protein